MPLAWPLALVLGAKWHLTGFPANHWQHTGCPTYCPMCGFANLAEHHINRSGEILALRFGWSRNVSNIEGGPFLASQTSEQSSFAKRYWRFDQLWKALDFYRKAHHFMCGRKWEWLAARLRPRCCQKWWCLPAVTKKLWLGQKLGRLSWSPNTTWFHLSILREAGFEDTGTRHRMPRRIWQTPAITETSGHEWLKGFLDQLEETPLLACDLKSLRGQPANSTLKIRRIDRWNLKKSGLTPPGNFETRFVVVSCHSLKQKTYS